MKRVLEDGVFFAATQLFGITFKARPDLKGYSPDMVVYEVFNADGTPLALFLGDFYARSNKRGGAWANAYVPQNGLRGNRPVIANHQNIAKPPEGQPTLMTYDEVETMFHEFGHALHGMFSQTKYPRFAGTSVPRDFVEFPSQVNEMWATWPSILKNYAKHHKTGEPIPQALLAKVEAASRFNQGHATTELVAANLIDQAWHQLGPDQVPSPEEVEAFEQKALRKAEVDFAPVPPRYRGPYFSHIFAGGYSAGYYSYFWSEVLDADAVEWFKSHGGLTRANGDRFRDTILSRGDSRDAKEMFRSFTGHDPDIRPLLVRRGLDVPTGP
jgi:peptidyl-dipeptidase Dcp